MKIKNLDEKVLLKSGFISNNGRYELELKHLDLECYLVVEDNILYGYIISPRVAYDNFDKDLSRFLDKIKDRDFDNYENINDLVSGLLSLGAFELDIEDHDN